MSNGVAIMKAIKATDQVMTTIRRKRAEIEGPIKAESRPPFADDDAARQALEDILHWRRRTAPLSPRVYSYEPGLSDADRQRKQALFSLLHMIDLTLNLLGTCHKQATESMARIERGEATGWAPEPRTNGRRRARSEGART
jgi:hypothetical protein